MPGRSRSNRPTSSVAKCSAWVALPPLPNQKTAPPWRTRSMTASAATASDGQTSARPAIIDWCSRIASSKSTCESLDGPGTVLEGSNRVILLDRDGVLNVDRVDSVRTARRPRRGDRRGRGVPAPPRRGLPPRGDLQPVGGRPGLDDRGRPRRGQRRARPPARRRDRRLVRVPARPRRRAAGAASPARCSSSRPGPRSGSIRPPPGSSSTPTRDVDAATRASAAGPRSSAPARAPRRSRRTPTSPPSPTSPTSRVPDSDWAERRVRRRVAAVASELHADQMVRV